MCLLAALAESSGLDAEVDHSGVVADRAGYLGRRGFRRFLDVVLVAGIDVIVPGAGPELRIAAAFGRLERTCRTEVDGPLGNLLVALGRLGRCRALELQVRLSHRLGRDVLLFALRTVVCLAHCFTIPAGQVSLGGRLFPSGPPSGGEHTGQ